MLLQAYTPAHYLHPASSQEAQPVESTAQPVQKAQPGVSTAQPVQEANINQDVTGGFPGVCGLLQKQWVSTAAAKLIMCF